MKKFMAIMLALVLALGMTSTAFAADPTGTITITNAVVDQTYSVYRILNLEWNETTQAYLYTVNEGWGDFISENNNFKVDELGYVTWVGSNEDATIAQVAKDALAYAEENSIDATATKKATSATEVFEQLVLGYYLVDSSLGALCVLDTTAVDISVTDKNDTETPTVDKDVDTQEEKTSAQVGDVVDYVVTIGAKKGAENYVLHDTMSAGLTFNNDVKVYVNDTELESSNYTVELNVKDSDDAETACTFHVEFKQEYLDTITEDTDIVVKYSATVNDDAVTNPGTNNAGLSYGDNNKTTSSTTTVYTSQIVINKYDGAKTDKSIKLADAKFVLKNSEGKYYKYTAATAEDAAKVEWVSVTGTGEEGAVTTTDLTKAVAAGDITGVTTNAQGAATFKGLEDGVYTLIETDAPDGYNLLSTNEVSVTIKAIEDTVVSLTADIANLTGSELPSTGGMGTTIFYVVGGMMMAAAFVLLITKRKVAAEK